MNSTYDHNQLENKWRETWEKDGLFQHVYFDDVDAVDPKNKYYILPQLPYPSGAGLHMGHSEIYIACDVYARYLRMKGKDIMQVVGWDSFGLPAENYAIKTNVHPKISTETAITNFISQIKLLGVSVDWDRTTGSHEPRYYKWTQWFFLFMYERGLAYRKRQIVNWCDGCKTVLANEQVVDGHCERCDTEVIHKPMEQWYLKITDFADRLDKDLDKVDWPEESVKRQRDWIGRKEGANITYKFENSDESITCFTTRPDTNFGASFVVLAPEHDLVSKMISGEIKVENVDEISAYVTAAAKKTELERISDVDNKTGVFTGLYVINKLNNKKLPVWISDFVIATFGTGAVVGVPAHDKRDNQFAMKFKLPIHEVVKPVDRELEDGEIFEDDGVAVNSDFINGLLTADAKLKVIEYIEANGFGEKFVNYRLRDWSISRQRFWGAPMPMLFDPEGNYHTVPFEDLPVMLPDDVDFIPTGQSPLTYSEEFQKGVEEKYGKGWKREVDTLDTFMDSSWYYFRYLDPNNEKDFVDPKILKTWMPVDFYLGGPEHVTGHLLYSRFFTKALFDAGYIDFDEPFLVHKHQGLIRGEDGRKMSKRWGNTVNPTDIINDYGADTARTYILFMGPLEQDKVWDTNGVKGVRKFYFRLWNVFNDDAKVRADKTSSNMAPLLHKTIKKLDDDFSKLKFNTAVAKLMELLNELEKSGSQLSLTDSVKLLKIIAPLAPYMTEELNEKLNGPDVKSIHLDQWPEHDENLATDDTFSLIIQINGKVRGKLDDVSLEESEQNIIEKGRGIVNRYLEGHEIVKEIYVKGKVLNFVVI